LVTNNNINNNDLLLLAPTLWKTWLGLDLLLIVSLLILFLRLLVNLLTNSGLWMVGSLVTFYTKALKCNNSNGLLICKE
jgi:hypothetical protein